MRERIFVWLAVLISVVMITGFLACGGTSSDYLTDNKVDSIQSDNIEKSGIGILFVDPNYHGNSRQKTATENELAESDYLVDGEDSIVDSGMNQISIEELKEIFGESLSFAENAENDSLDDSASIDNDMCEEIDQSNFYDPDLEGKNIRNLGGGFSVFGKFYVRIRGIDSHPLRPCVYNNVSHFNITIKQDLHASDSDAWANIHLGAWISSGRLCLVAFDNISGFCKKICTPSRYDLQKLIEHSIKSALAAVGIYVSAYVIYVSAYTLSCLLYPLLIAL